MAILVSPGVSVSVIDESVYGSAGPGTVPLIVLPVHANKAHPSGTGLAEGTVPSSSEELFMFTSQRELIQTLGDPVFYQNQGTALQGYELNEYGLLAAYQYLGIANRALVLKANVDMAQLYPSVSEPRQEALTGTYWLDTSATSWGIFTSNGNPVPGLAWASKTPIVVDTSEETETLLLGNVAFSSLSVTPVTTAGTLTINTGSVNLLTTDSVSSIIAKINAASIPNITATSLMLGDKYYLLLRNSAGSAISVSVGSGSPILANIGFLGELDFLAPKLTLGLEGDFAVVTLSNDNVMYQKLTPKDYTGSSITGATPFWFVVGSDAWKKATPTVVVGSTSPLPYSIGDDIVISDGTNSVNVTFTGTTVSQAVTDINNAISALSASARPTIVAQAPGTALIITNTNGGDVTITDAGNRVASVTITSPGTGYTSLPTVSFTGGSGSGAAASQIFGTTSVEIERYGAGYSIGDTLTVLGGTSTSQAALLVSNVATYTGVQDDSLITIASGGTGYGNAQTFDVTIVGGTGVVAAVINVTTDASGVVTTINSITKTGYYTVEPTGTAVATTGGTGTGLTFDLSAAGVFDNFIRANSVTIGAAGSGYNVDDILTLSGGTSNYPAKVKVISVNGTGGVTGISLYDVGEYYTGGLPSNPASTTGGAGTGCTINIASSGILSNALASVTVAGSGSYSTVPTNPASVQGGTGTDATFTLTNSLIDSGVKLKVVGSPTINEAGSGYAVGDFIDVLGGTYAESARFKVLTIKNYNRLDSAEIAAGGAGYAVGDILSTDDGIVKATFKVTGVSAGGVTAIELLTRGEFSSTGTITADATTTDGVGSGCTLTYDVVSVSGGVQSIEIIKSGLYSAIPTNAVATETTGLGDNEATFTLVYGIGKVELTSSGDGYTTAPTVSFTGGGGSGATATVVLGENSETLTNLGISSKKGNRLFYSAHTSIPTNSVTGDVWVKTTEPNKGSDYVVKVYSRTTRQWSTIDAPLYATDDDASLDLGLTSAAGTLYVQYNLYGTTSAPQASHMVKRWTGAGPKVVTGSITNPTVTAGDSFSIEFLDQNRNEKTITVLLTGTTVAQTVIDINNKLSAEGVTNVQASQSSGKLVITHSEGLSLTFADVSGEPLADVGIFSGLHSNWEGLAYEASVNEPTTEAAEGTMWFNPNFRVDVMVSDGDQWKGYRNVYPTTDPNGVQIASTAPLTQSDGTPLVDNDLWIDSSLDSLENYPKFYRWSSSDSAWTPIDTTDQTTPFGMVFADARYTSDGSSDGSEDIEDLLVSDYVDPDLALVADPRTYPSGMILFNTRYSTYNVKEWNPDYLEDYVDLEYGVGASTFAAGTITTTNKGRWVTLSGNRTDGTPYMGRKAQRAVIVRAMQSALNSNQDIRAEDVFFNLIACPGYPELIDEMVTLNVDKKEIAFIIGDTPARLAPNATDIVAWATNASNQPTNNEDGLASQGNTYVGMYYPWGFTSTPGSGGAGSNTQGGLDVMVPPSHMVLRTMAYNDQVAYQWFAPAGFTRGLVSNATSVGYLTSEGEFKSVSLSEGLRDVLYTNRINPIANIPGRGLVVYGQKTLHPFTSALDRVNVARLINYLRYNFDLLAKPFLFEPNDQQTRDQVKSVFERFMANLVSLRGVYDYAVVCDESNNTADRIDRNELWIDVAIQPVKAIEFIYIPIRVRNTGEDLN